jgi:hypothetical protein
MKADTTRSTFKQSKHYNSVLLQQGRVQLDADWNEQIDITGHRIETEAIDVIGHCGAPYHNAGFHLVANANDLTAEEKKLTENATPAAIVAGDLLISGGRYYVDGILCENDRIVPYTNQPDYPAAAANPLQPGWPRRPVINTAGTYLAYIDVWSRHLTALEDPSIREVALGGPDTATRAKTIWQIKLFRVGAANLNANCATAFATWDAEIAAGTGKMAARAEASVPAATPCIVAPGAGYRRLENQHYRVEVHTPGPRGTATFKWSRDNGSIVTRWESKNLNDLTVSSIGRDKVLNFSSGQWVELTDDSRELNGLPGTLVQLVKAEGNVLTINPATATGPVDFANFPGNPKVRRWDQVALLTPTNDDWLNLEDGVQAQFTAGTYKSGDYWQVPARTATADVEWPRDPATNLPVTQLPAGILHHYCRLSVLKHDGTNWTSITDCRHVFPPLTELIDFSYAGGDGQEVVPDPTQPAAFLPLPHALEASVTNDRYPIAGAAVRFTITQGNGRLQGAASPQTVATGPNGVAACAWSLDSTSVNQQVEAVLLDDAGLAICAPVHYNANLSVASQVSYNPGNVCTSMQGQTTVQGAIDTLATLASLYLVSGDDQPITPGAGLDPLVVIAASKCGPAAGMKVVFTVKAGGGQVRPQGGGALGSSVTVNTNAQGLAGCEWVPGTGGPKQIVEAVLQPGPNPVVPPLLVQFTAQVPGGGTGAEPGFHVKDLLLPGPNRPLKNNADVALAELERGIRLNCDDAVDPASLKSKHPTDNPVCYVMIDVPYPLTPGDRDFFNTPRPVVFQPMKLGAAVEGQENVIIWQPARETMAWLSQLFGRIKAAQIPELVLARLVVHGNFIWSRTNPDLLLDADLFAVRDQDEVRLPSGDNRRGGNLDLYFWLRPGAVDLGPGFNFEVAGGRQRITGSVLDVAGAPIAGATVTVNVPGAAARTAVTDAGGKFVFTNIPSGSYDVTVNVGGATVSKNVVVP